MNKTESLLPKYITVMGRDYVVNSFLNVFDLFAYKQLDLCHKTYAYSENRVPQHL